MFYIGESRGMYHFSCGVNVVIMIDFVKTWMMAFVCLTSYSLTTNISMKHYIECYSTVLLFSKYFKYIHLMTGLIGPLEKINLLSEPH